MRAWPLLLLIAGCSQQPGLDPVDWWHKLEGGRLAEARPAPPNADAPYPNLATIPARPDATDPASRARIATALEADRRSAAADAGLPIAPPAAAAPPPRAVAAAPPGAIGASLQAANAPPAAPQAPPPARPAAPPVAPTVAAPAPPPAQIGAARVMPTAPPAAADPFAAMPPGPPRPPQLAGVPAATRPTPPRVVPPPPTQAAAPPRPGAPVPVAFRPDSAVLPEAAPAALRSLAATRGTADLVVAGYGEAGATDPASQAASLRLAFARAQAIATVLAQAGVPMASIRLTGEAIGRGGVARVAP